MIIRCKAESVAFLSGNFVFEIGSHDKKEFGTR